MHLPGLNKAEIFFRLNKVSLLNKICERMNNLFSLASYAFFGHYEFSGTISVSPFYAAAAGLQRLEKNLFSTGSSHLSTAN